MKVGLIIPGFSADAADWCIPVLVDVVRELSRRAEVHVFALRYPNRRDRYSVHGAVVHALGGGTVRGLQRPGLLATAGARIVAEHRRSPFAVLHGLWVDEPGFTAVAVARALRVPAVVSVMGGELVAMPDIDYGGRLARSNRLLSALALAGANRVTAGSRQAAEVAQRTQRRPEPAAGPSRRVATLAWGIDPCLFGLHGPSLDLAGRLRVLHVASLVPIKDQATLLRAIARVKEAEPGVHLHIVGDGPLRGLLIDQARRLDVASSVTFHGHVDRRELAVYYRSVHVVAISSRHEAQPVVALEAALCGTPVVGTAVGLVADFAPQAAIAVLPGDDAALADAICRALQPERRQALGTAVHRLVESEYLAAQTAEKLMSLYRTLTMAKTVT